MWKTELTDIRVYTASFGGEEATDAVLGEVKVPMIDLLLEIVQESSTVLCQTSWQKVLPVLIFFV